MVKDDAIIVVGEVKENLGPGWYRVWLAEYSMDVTATLSGKMQRLHRISVLPWDFVDVELNPYDMKKGRIVYRHNQKRWIPNNFVPRNMQNLASGTPEAQAPAWDASVKPAA